MRDRDVVTTDERLVQRQLTLTAVNEVKQVHSSTLGWTRKFGWVGRVFNISSMQNQNVATSKNLM